MPHLHIIVAIAQNNAIGYHNQLLYHLPQDLRHFKQCTLGHTVLMGRRTFESLPKGALPQRRNIVLSRTQDTHDGAETYASLTEALAHCTASEEVYIIGGAAVYAEGLTQAETLHITYIYATPVAADAYFPTLDLSQWTEVSREAHTVDEKHAHPFDFVTYTRTASHTS